jgi:hypothetical protein
MFQWGTHLVPARGSINWSEMVRNQFVAVPRQLGEDLGKYLFHRSALMKSIERADIEQTKAKPAPKP